MEPGAMPEPAGYPGTLHLRSYAASHQGARSNNEDEFYRNDERGIYFVVDGMGGHAAGERAAALAKQRLIGRLERPAGTPEQRVREAIALANNAIFEAASARPEWRGMACVLTVAVVENGRATVGHVGDSRIYKIARGAITKISRDHSPVGEQEDRHELSEEEAMRHPRRNEVYRDVGSAQHEPDEPNFIDIYEVPVEPGAALLLCSDGLSDKVPAAEILSIIEREAPHIPGIVDGLITRALREPGDNISVVFVQAGKFGSDPESLRARPGALHGKPALAAAAKDAGAAPDTPVSGARDSAGRHSPWWKSAALAIAWMAAGALLTLLAQWLLTSGMFRPEPVRTGASRHILVSPRDGNSPIMTALQSANAGDTIEIAPGEYREQIRARSGVTLLAKRAAILVPAAVQEDPGIAVVCDHAEPCSLSGFRILGTGQVNLATGIVVRGGTAAIRDVEVAGARFAGIEFSAGATGALQDSSIHDNAGPGVLVRENASPVLIRNRIVDNGRPPGVLRPGIQILSAQAVRMAGNTFANNGAGAIWQPFPPAPDLLLNNIFGTPGRTGRPGDIRITPAATAQQFR